MKVGMRTPSLDKTVRAKTTGRVKRTAKRAVNPVYGIKGVGYLKDPERAVKNKIYHKLTVDPLDPLKHPSDDIPISEPSNHMALLGLCITIFLFSLAYFFIMLAVYKQLRLVALSVLVLSFIGICIFSRRNK